MPVLERTRGMSEGNVGQQEVVTRPYLDAWNPEEFAVVKRDVPEVQLCEGDLVRLVEGRPAPGDVGFERGEGGCHFFLCEGDGEYVWLRILKKRGGWRKQQSPVTGENRYWIVAESCRGWTR